jgi:hypothetical protein
VGVKIWGFLPFMSRAFIKFDAKNGQNQHDWGIGSETPAQPSQRDTPASERVPVEQQHWRCEICKGNWYETNEFGADWMINKVQILMRKTGALSHECDACTGVTWDGGHEKRGTETGLYWAGNTPWVLKGFAKDWISAPKASSRAIDRPLWTPPEIYLISTQKGESES